MNKHAYRVIFSKSRGIMMAVSEHVSGHGGGSGSQGSHGAAGAAYVAACPHGRPPTLHRLACAVALLVGAVTPVASQIVGDPAAAAARRVLVETTANGRPLVRIAAPNAAGVSHNQYSQYNVDAQGAVLNNASKITQTQLAGYVDGNPNLAGGGARLILNEVTGASASQLNGRTEVAGARAEVVIANPNGISCNGCGFINASRGVLTTGTPVLDASGALEGFRVVAGSVQIGAQGLPGDNMDQLDLIARSVEVNGAIWGKQLSVIVGPNQVRYSDLGVQLMEGAGAAPTVAIDVARLGGMYGDKIRLIGTEAGVGVNSGGAISSGAGTLVINTMGKLTLSGGVAGASADVTLHGADGVLNNAVINAGTQLTITGAGSGVVNHGTLSAKTGLSITGTGAGGVFNDGVVSAQTDLRISGAGDVINNGAIGTAADLTITGTTGVVNSGVVSANGNLTVTGASVASTGTLAAGVDALGVVGHSGKLTVTTGGRLDATGRNIAGGDIAMDGSALDLSDSDTDAGANMTLTANNADIRLGRSLTVAKGNITVTAKAGTVYNNAASRDASRKLEAGHIDIEAAALDNTNGIVNQTGDLASTIHLTGTLANNGGSIASNGQNLTLESGTLNNNDGEIRHAGPGLFTITAADIHNQRGIIKAGGAGVINAASLDNLDGRITALGAEGLGVTVTGELSNAGATAPDGTILGLIASNGATTVTGGTVRNSGVISAAGTTGTLTVNAIRWLDNSSGKLLADGLLTSSAGTDWTNTSGTVAGNQISLAGNSLSNQYGMIRQTGAGDTTIDARSGRLDNQHGAIRSNAGTLIVSSGDLVNDDGIIDHAGDGLLRIDSAALSNLKGPLDDSGAIRSNGHVAITAAAVTNNGAITAQKTLQLSATSLHNDGGTIASNAGLTVKAGALLTNVKGSLRAGSASASVSAATLDNSGGEISAGTLDIDATTLTNRNGAIYQNDAAGSAIFTVRQTLNNREGEISVAAADLKLAPVAALRNNGGTITHTGHGKLTVDSASLVNDSGTLGSNGEVVATVGVLSNRAGTLTAVDKLTMTSTSAIDNSAIGDVAGLLAGASVHVTADNGLVDNRGGIIEATDGLTVQAQSVDNGGGAIRNQGVATLKVKTSGAVINAGGTLRSRGDVRVDAVELHNRNGSIQADGANTVVSGAGIDNAEGDIRALGNVSVSALGVLHNTGGKILALGDSSTLGVTVADVDNTGGRIVNIGSGATIISAIGEILNANPAALEGAGLIGGNGDVTVNAATLRNLQAARLTAGGALTLNPTVLLDNSGGKLMAGGMLRMKQAAARIVNQGGEISGQQVDLASASLDNTNGLIANPKGSGGHITIGTGTLINTAGRIASDHDLWLTAVTLQGKGYIAGGRDATVSLQGNYTNEADNVFAANGMLTLSTTGILTNAGTLSAAGSITLNAAGVTNLGGAVIASGNVDDRLTGATTINVAGGAIDNVGRIEGNTVSTNSSTLHNTGSVIGDIVTIAADRIDNDGSAAIIAGVGQVNLFAKDVLSNHNGATVFSLGDLAIAADDSRDANGRLVHRTGVIDNLSSTIEADGVLEVAADVVNNVRENVHTETVVVADQTYTLTPLPWTSAAAPNIGTPQRNSNTVRKDAYYLDPKAILSDEPFITPDGYVIHKAVVNLSATDSAFQWMRGGLSYPLPDNGGDVQYGSQSRLPVQSGTRVIYYLRRLDNQTNPDQVEGSTAWLDAQKFLVRNTLGTITYSANFSNCTSNCVRLETIPDYNDPLSSLNHETNIVNGNVPNWNVFAIEVQRKAHQTITETRLAEDIGAPAAIRSGGATHLNIGTLLNNDNGQIAAGGNLFINDVQSVDGSENAKVRNTSTQLTRTYTFVNTSGFGTAMLDSPPVQEERTWSNPSIVQPIGSAGGSITSNRAVVISARQVNNNNVAAVDGPGGASPSSFGLGEDVSPYAGSAADRTVKRTDLAINPVAASPGVSGARTSVALPNTVRTVDGARAGALGPTLPSSGLYRIVPPPTQPYLVESDPRFTSYQNFISSDYQLERLGIKPAKTQKRLGDGFYEQRLVLSQVTAMTGKRYLAGVQNAEEEYIALMNNGVQYAQQFGLVPGITLSDTQMVALTSDMVWLVEQTVTLPDGSQQTVLAPQVYLARNPQITPTGALIAGDTLQIDATDVDNRGGTLASNRQLFIKAEHDIDNSGGSIAGGDVRLRGGNDILSRSQTTTERTRSGNSSSTVTSVSEVSRIAAIGKLSIDAGRDLSLQGAQISAGGDAGLLAGRKIDIGAVETGSQYSATGASNASTVTDSIFNRIADKLTGPASSYQSASTHQTGSTVRSGGNLAVISGGDIAIEGSKLTAGQDMLVAGKGKVDIVNTTDSNSLAMSVRTKGYRGSSDLRTDTANGSRLQADGSVAVYAGATRDAAGNLVVSTDGSTPAQDLTVRASSIAAGLNPDSAGRVTLRASGNVDIGAAITQFDSRLESRSASSNAVSSRQSHDIEQLSASTAQGSTVTGAEVNVVAGRDLNLRGSAVAGSRDVALNAEGNVTISAAQDRQAQYTLHDERQSGIFSNNGGLTMGSRSQREESNTDASTESRLRSMVGSSGGDVSITAKGNVTLAGSDVVAGRDVNLTGKNVYLDTGTDSSQNHTTQDSKQSGLTVTLSGAIPTAARAAGQALDRKVQSQDGRIAALQGVKAGMTINNYLDGVQQAEAKDAINAANGEAGAEPTAKPVAFKIAITAGSSKSHSESDTRQQAQSGSSIVGVNNVRINATGSGAKDRQGQATDGDIVGVGVQITGKNVSLDAARDIDLKAAQQTVSNRSNSSSSSAGVGIGFAVGGEQNGLTIELAAATAKGKSNFDSLTYQASEVTASDTLRMKSGRDTTLQGAQVKGDRVEMKVGRDLNIGSTQDTEVLDVKQESAGFNLSVCVPPICYGSAVQGSASYNRAATNSKYSSVQKQSGVFAGKGGYDIDVKGNTELVGAVIASAADPEQNRLKTATLTQRDLQNEAAYSSSSVGVSASTSSGSSSSSKPQGSTGVTPNIGVSSGGSASGITKSAISPGTIIITDEAGQIAKTGKSAEQTIADTNRDTARANGAINKIFDQKKVQQQQELAQLVGEVGFQAVGMVAQKFNLADGSPEKIALHAAVGFIQAQAGGSNALAGAIAAGATEAINTMVADYLKAHTELSPGQRNAIQQWAAVMSGGAVGALLAGNGTGAKTGAAVALDGERFNRQLHPQIKPFISDLAKKQSTYSEQELQAAARVVLGNDRVADGTRRSYDSEAQASADGVSKVTKAPDGRYYEAIAASPEAIAYVSKEMRTGPSAIQTEFDMAQLDKLKYDHKPWQTELENSGLELLNTITVIGSNGAAPTVQGGAGVGRRAGSGVTNGANGGVTAGELTGTRTPISSADDAATIRSLTRENESATTLANNGYRVQQNPPSLPNGKNPDYIVNGQIFDNYAPSTGNVRNAARVIEVKVAVGQADHVVVNLTDSLITPSALKDQLTNYPIPGLKQVIIIDKTGTPTVIHFLEK